MKTITIILSLLLVGKMLAQQGNYEQAMNSSIELWQEGKINEASSQFERIAAAEKDNWLPDYYLALVNATSAFQMKDPAKLEATLAKAQTAVNNATTKAGDNAEILVLQAMIHTVRIAYDPMTKGQELSPKVMEIYAKAQKLEPENPRVILSKAQFEMGSARFFNRDIKPYCAEIKRALPLFDAHVEREMFYPSWGKNDAEETLSSCL